MLVTCQLQVQWLPADLAGLVIGALFILPFLLFSATSGQLADKLDRRDMIVWLKRAEIGIKDNLIRFSCGIEPMEDIWADLVQALDTI